MMKTRRFFFGLSRAWLSTSVFASVLTLVLALVSGAFAADRAPATDAQPPTLVWIGPFPQGIVPMRPLAVTRQDGVLTIKGGAVATVGELVAYPLYVFDGQTMRYYTVVASAAMPGGRAIWPTNYGNGHVFPFSPPLGRGEWRVRP